MKPIFKLILLSLLCTLSACGFHLRNYNMIPAKMKVMYLESLNPYDKITNTLRNDLRMLGVTLVDNPKDAPITLQIIDASLEKNLTNISSNTQVRTYTLILFINFQIKDGTGKVILGPQTVTATSSYSTSDNQLLADNQALILRRQQLERDLVFQLLMRLNAKFGSKTTKPIR